MKVIFQTWNWPKNKQPEDWVETELELAVILNKFFFGEVEEVCWEEMEGDNGHYFSVDLQEGSVMPESIRRLLVQELMGYTGIQGKIV